MQYTLGVPSNNARRYRACNPPSVGAFTRGSAPIRDNRAQLWALSHPQMTDLTLTDSVPVVTMSRPWRDLTFTPATPGDTEHVCPGCGIVPPRSKPCDQCW